MGRCCAASATRWTSSARRCTTAPAGSSFRPSRLDDAFFQLRTRVAGDIVQKFVNYRCGIAIVGDISGFTGHQFGPADFVRECNRGTQAWFLPDIEDFHKQLDRLQASSR